jgi:hypothetical protein
VNSHQMFCSTDFGCARFICASVILLALQQGEFTRKHVTRSLMDKIILR